jgi:hypothetical protein
VPAPAGHSAEGGGAVSTNTTLAESESDASCCRRNKWSRGTVLEHNGAQVVITAVGDEHILVRWLYPGRVGLEGMPLRNFSRTHWKSIGRRKRGEVTP